MKYIHKNDIFTVFGHSGKIMIAIGIMCLVPIIFDLIYFEFNSLGFIIAGFFSIILGLIFHKGFEKYSQSMRLKHGMMISSFAWLWAALVGGIAISLVTGTGYLNGVFESMSALTGSGVSMFTDVEALPYSILFFRSFEQWIGGLGVVVMVIGLLRPGTTSSKLYQSEAHEDRIKPSIKNTLSNTFNIYAIYTIVGIILYIIVGMPVFDSICATFSSIATGGMSIKNGNFGFYNSDAIYIITMILMVLGATSFQVHYKIIKTKGKSLVNDLQFKVMIAIIAIVSLLIYFSSNIVPVDVLFTVISAITTTGAAINTSSVLDTWPSFALVMLMGLMLIGGSSGSTVGAIKLTRVITFIKGVYKHIKEIISPEGRIIPIKISNHVIPEKSIGEVGTFITLYLVFILISWIIFCYYGCKPFESLFGIVSLQGNVGLELGVITNQLNPILKTVCIFNMWIGRLEIYPVLLFLRAFLEIFRR